MTKSVENAKPIGKLLEAVHDVVERDLALKLYEPKHLRLTIAKRKEVAQVYIASGMSQREAALALGVNQSTIQRDLGKKKQPGRANSPDEGKKTSNKSEPSGANSLDEQAKGSNTSTSSGSNRPESEGDGQGQEKDWRVRNTRGWLNQEVNFAVSAHKKHGQPKQKKVEYHRDPNILLQAVDEPEKKAASLRKGGCALIARGRTLLTLAEAVESAFGLLPPEDTASDSAE